MLVLVYFAGFISAVLFIYYLYCRAYNNPPEKEAIDWDGFSGFIEPKLSTNDN